MTFYISTTPYRTTRRWSTSTPYHNGHSLPVDIRDEDEAYVLTTFVPGLSAEELNIQILDDTLSIEGEYKPADEEYLVSELPKGGFRRTLRLPTELNAEKAEAKIENGVLTLRVPKAESARPKVIKVATR